MHLRFSTCVGVAVLDEATDEPLALISGVLVHPDTGKIEGFFVRTPGMFRGQELFLASQDIAHWGMHVRVRHADALSPLEDRIRLTTLLEDGRTVLGQTIVNESGVRLGTCADIQFDTTHFMLEWLFPKLLWRWKPPVPASAIVEVRAQQIVVRDAKVKEPSRPMKVLKKIDELTEPPVQRPLDA